MGKHAEALELATVGARTLLERNHGSSGGDLALLVVETLNATAAPVDTDSIGALLQTAHPLHARRNRLAVDLTGTLARQRGSVACSRRSRRMPQMLAIASWRLRFGAFMWHGAQLAMFAAPRPLRQIASSSLSPPPHHAYRLLRPDRATARESRSRH